MHLLQRVKLAWTQYRAFQASLAELNGYSDRELSDLGLTCADIVRHLAAAERFIFVEVALGGTSRYPGHDKALAYGKEGVLAYLDTMHEQSMALLQKLDDRALEHRITTPAGAQIPTWRWLQLMAEHEAHRRGQLDLMLRLIGVETPPLFGMTEEQLTARSNE